MSSLNKWFEEKFKQEINDNPEWATILGYKINYNKLDDISEKKKEDNIEQYKNDLKELLSFDDKENIYFETYKYDLLNKIDDETYRYYQYPIDHLDGIHTSFINFMLNFHLIEDKKDAWAYVQRLVLFENKIDETIENIRIRLNEKKGIPPTFIIDYIVDDCNNIIKNNINNDIFTNDITSKLKKTSMDENTKKKIIKITTKVVIKIIIPSYKKLILFLNEIKKYSDNDDGVWKFGNPNYYIHMIKYHTTLQNVDPENIFNFGLMEVKRIHKEIHEKIMEPMNYGQYSVEQFFLEIQKNKIFYLKNSEENKKNMLKTYKEYIDTIKNNLDEVFLTKPKNNLIVKEVEEYRIKTSAEAFYHEGSYNNKRPGIFYVNLYKIETCPTYEMESLAYHEGIPGHHLQISIADELDNESIPKFQKHISHTAYVEGWALYAEYLAKEMGFFTDIYSDLGRLNYELLRACRLVVDVGIHWKKWKKNDAILYLTKNMIMSDYDAKKAIERYIVTPGQALSYKIGMALILRLRKTAIQKLGDKFDIREFHDVILQNGSLPLFLLKKNIDKYIESKNK